MIFEFTTKNKMLQSEARPHSQLFTKRGVVFKMQQQLNLFTTTIPGEIKAVIFSWFPLNVTQVNSALYACKRKHCHDITTHCKICYYSRLKCIV